MSGEKGNTSLAIVPRTIDEVQSLAERFSQSSLLPAAMRGKMPDVLVTIMAGQELGLPPMASLRAIHVIDGKPVLAADGMVAAVLGSGKCVYFERVEESDTAVTYETLRVGATKPRRCTWTLEMAKKAGLHLKDNWRTYLRAMLASRAKSELARDVYPDVLAGCYTDEEVASQHPRPEYVPPARSDLVRSETKSEKHADVIDAEVVSETVEVPELTAIGEPATLEALQAAVPKLEHLTGAAKKAARAWYSAQLTRLEQLPTLSDEEAKQRKTRVVPAANGDAA